MHINYINYHLELVFTLFSSVILTEIQHFDISNCSTSSKIGLSTPVLQLGGIRYMFFVTDIFWMLPFETV